MRLRRGATVAVLAGSLLAPVSAAPASAGHGHGPSARAVAAGRAAVSQRERQVRRAAARLVDARAALQQLQARAEIAIEAYNGARVREVADRRQATAADVVLAAATHQLGSAQQRVARFARTAYITGGLSSIDALLTANGPQDMIDRAGTLEVISRSQRDATEAFDAARVYQLVVSRQAHTTLLRAQADARAAARARSQAQKAVAQQTAALTSLVQRRHRLARLLADARRHASALERARLLSIARARARAAARAAAAQVVQTQHRSTGGATGAVAGTVSASTEQQAVQQAESQIGKPYEWGAAGPDTYDCSGLTMWAYAQVGVHIDHYTGYQWQEGVRIATSAMRPGDLAFFATNTSDPNTIHHVGMYIGNGEMVEAPYTGANVRISSVWRPDLIGVIRPYAG